MKTARIIRRSVIVGVLFVTGCAADVAGRSDGQSAATAQVVRQDQARELATQYRRQAAELRELARRVEWEARWYAGRFGVNDRDAAERQDQAQQLWIDAEEADQLALGYRRQVPHGQVQ